MGRRRTNPIIQRGTECRVCLGPHSAVEHRRTDELHAWFRDELLRKIQPPAIGVKPKFAKPGFGRTPLVIDEATAAATQPQPEPEDAAE